MTATGAGVVSQQQSFAVNVTSPGGGGGGGSQSYVFASYGGTVLSTGYVNLPINTPRIEARLHQIPAVTTWTPVATLGDGPSGVNIWLMPSGNQVQFQIESPQDYTWCNSPALAAGADVIFRYQRGTGTPTLTVWSSTQPTVAQAAGCFSNYGGSTNSSNLANAAKFGQVPGAYQPSPPNLAIAWLRIFDGHDASGLRPSEAQNVVPTPVARWEMDGALAGAVTSHDLAVVANAGTFVATPPFETTITVTPATVTLNTGMTQIFTGSAGGANPAVTWTLLPYGSPVSGGSYSYTAPPVGSSVTQTLRVTSVATGAFKDVPIQVQAIQLAWSSTPPLTVAPGQQLVLNVTMGGNLPGASTLVNWTATGGTLSMSQAPSFQGVVWTAPSAGSNISVTATSVQNPSGQATWSFNVSAPPPAVTVSFIEPPTGASIGPGGIRPVAVQSSAATSPPGAAWRFNNGPSYQPADFFSYPAYKIPLPLGWLQFVQDSATQSWRNYFAPSSVGSPTTLTFRGTNLQNTTAYAERTLTLTNVTPPPSYYTGGITPNPASVNQFHTVAVRREDVAGGNQGGHDLWLSLDMGTAQGNASYYSCHINFVRTGTTWSMYINDYGLGASPNQVVGQPGQVSMGSCTVDGAGSSVTAQGNLLTFTVNVKAEPGSPWFNRWIYVLRPDGTVLDQYWMGF